MKTLSPKQWDIGLAILIALILINAFASCEAAKDCTNGYQGVGKAKPWKIVKGPHR